MMKFNKIYFLNLLMFCTILLLTGRMLYAQEWLQRRIVYEVPGMDKVKAHKNITYKSDQGVDVKMDIYEPNGLSKDERLPGVIFIHGGYLSRDQNPMPKDWGVYVSYGEVIAASGMVGVTFNHRYYGWDEENLKMSFGDVTDAIKFVRKNADKYHVDPDRLALWAFSGGGPHLSIALREKLDYVRCIISYYAMLDLSSMVELFGPGVDLQVVKQFSPLDYLNEENYHVPPIFIGRAGLDGPSLNKSVTDFVIRAFALNENIEVMNHPDGQHGFDIEDNDDRSREIIARTLEFIKTHTKRKTNLSERDFPSAGRLYSMIQRGKIEKVKNLYEGTKNSSAVESTFKRFMTESNLNIMGYGLLQERKIEEALDVFLWNVELYPQSPNVYDSLADGYEANGQAELAIQNSEKALKMLDEAKDIDQNRRNSIKRTSEERLKRLKK